MRGSDIGVETAGTPALGVKIHPRCVNSVEHLRATLDRLCKGGYTIEIRHNMYMIKSTEPLNQKELARKLREKKLQINADDPQVAELLGIRNNDETDNVVTRQAPLPAGESSLEQGAE